MPELAWAARRRAVFERARGYCEYCRSHEENTGQAMHVEHIVPKVGDDLDNLCLSCANCNLHKAQAVESPDPETGTIETLFNPRTQRWDEHFEWSDSGMSVMGLTGTGRATVERLQMNVQRMVRARRNWFIAGTHPPKD